VRDPRAAVLEAALGLLGEEPAGRSRLEVGRRVEQAARTLLQERGAGRRLEANVEFYTAVLLDAIGIERRDFSPTFATARVAGWCAHIIEHRRSGRLVRPALRYVGPQPELAA
jgi:citrate synthase